VEINEVNAQIVGLILIAVTLLSPHFITRQSMLLSILSANILSCVMFFLVDARTGLFALIVTTVRSVVYWGYSTKKRKAPIFVLLSFVLAQIAATAIGWVDWFSLLTLGLVFNTYGQWQTNTKVLRACMLISAICIGLYCIYTGAYIGAINKFLQGGSTLFALYRAEMNRMANVGDTDEDV